MQWSGNALLLTEEGSLVLDGLAEARTAELWSLDALLLQGPSPIGSTRPASSAGVPAVGLEK